MHSAGRNNRFHTSLFIPYARHFHPFRPLCFSPPRYRYGIPASLPTQPLLPPDMNGHRSITAFIYKTHRKDANGEKFRPEPELLFPFHKF